MTATAAKPAPSSAEFRRLTQHSSAYMAGIALSLCLGFISFPVFTRMFPVAEYGMIDLAQKGLLIGAAFSKIGLQNSALRFYEAKPAYYTTYLLGVMSLATVVGCAVFALSTGYFHETIIPLLLGALVAIRAVASMALCFYRAESRPGAYNTGLIGTRIITIGAILLLLSSMTATIRTFLYGTAFAEAVAVVVYLCSLVRRGLIQPRTFDLPRLKVALSFGIPLIAYETATLILDSGDRLLVRHYLGGEALGRYSVAYGLSTYVNELLVTPLRLAAIPIYVRMWSEKGARATAEFLETSLGFLFLVSGLLICGATLTASDVIHLLAGSKYDGIGNLVPIVIAGLLIYTAHIFLGAGLLLAKRTGLMAIILIVSAAVNVGLNVVLIPQQGMLGAAVSTLLSYAVCVGLLWKASYSTIPVSIPWTRVIISLLAAGLAFAVGSMLTPADILVRLVLRAFAATITYLAVVTSLDRQVAALVRSGVLYPGRLLASLR